MTSYESNPRASLDEARAAKQSVLECLASHGIDAGVGIGSFNAVYYVKVSAQDKIDVSFLPLSLGNIPIIVEYVGPIRAQNTDV